ncbi:hypothetical protein QFC24_005093 [Naganishia onofrii]|uniref:Uncharacterized protein n=1 Tax=Naganishia onofrii TaxID=1851511 RepID=A0ACC2XCJ6_9TREE|nr:hypothetical protein QFC24_005093 [Naganishia onofrii]
MTRIEQPPIGHTCFEMPLPALPYGYQFDLQRPLMLVPFASFEGHLPNKHICRDCYIRAVTNYDVAVVNSISARATIEDPASVALAGLDRHVASVNTVNHPMYNDIYPIVPREGRALAFIQRHFARRGTAKREPCLSYMIKYRIPGSPVLSPFVLASEFDLRRYQNAGAIIHTYWYGEQPHKINSPFVRSILTRLTPFANTAIWRKLPQEEADALMHLWRIGRLDEWYAGMEMKDIKSREDLA